MPFMLDCQCTICPSVMAFAFGIGSLEVSLRSRLVLALQNGGCRCSSFCHCLRSVTLIGGMHIAHVAVSSAFVFACMFLGVLVHVHACFASFGWSRSVCLSSLVSLLSSLPFVLCVVCFVLLFWVLCLLTVFSYLVILILYVILLSVVSCCTFC